MLKTLKFVQGAIAKKDLVPYMQHFSIKDGNILAYNGTITLSSPIAIDIDCKPKAAPLISAINNCSETIAISLTEAGRLKVQSGKFKAFIDCIDELTPNFKPEGSSIGLDGKTLIDALTKLVKFVGDDASRPWANGILIANGSACATNNVCIVECWLGYQPAKPINIPKEAIREILRIGDIPEEILIGERSITLKYESGRWIKSQLLDCGWPDLGKILNKESNTKPIDKEIFAGLSVLKPFKDKLGRIYFTEGLLSTSDDITTSANYEVESVDFDGIYNFDMLSLLEGSATVIDWHQSPSLFFGEGLRGAIVGMRR